MFRVVIRTLARVRSPCGMSVRGVGLSPGKLKWGCPLEELNCFVRGVDQLLSSLKGRRGRRGAILGSELFEGIKRGMSLGFGWTYTTSGRAVITMIIQCFRVVSGGEGCHDCLFQGGW